MSQTVKPVQGNAKETPAPCSHWRQLEAWLDSPLALPTDVQAPPSIRSGDRSLDAPSVLILFEYDPSVGT